MTEVMITDPVMYHITDPELLYKGEFLVATILCGTLDDVIACTRYNTYVNDKKVENE